MSKKTTEEKRATDSPSLSFEEAHSRLEELLESVHRETLSLDDSILLYEEADRLLSFCQKKLREAEQKIEKLIKNRKGEGTECENEEPRREPFTLSSLSN